MSHSFKGLPTFSTFCLIDCSIPDRMTQLFEGFITFAYPNSPHKPEQAYKLTAKGLDLYKQLT